MSYSFDFPDEEADKYEREVMDLYGPDSIKPLKAEQKPVWQSGFMIIVSMVGKRLALHLQGELILFMAYVIAR